MVREVRKSVRRNLNEVQEATDENLGEGESVEKRKPEREGLGAGSWRT